MLQVKRSDFAGFGWKHSASNGGRNSIGPWSERCSGVERNLTDRSCRVHMGVRKPDICLEPAYRGQQEVYVRSIPQMLQEVVGVNPVRGWRRLSPPGGNFSLREGTFSFGATSPCGRVTSPPDVDFSTGRELLLRSELSFGGNRPSGGNLSFGAELHLRKELSSGGKLLASGGNFSFGTELLLRVGPSPSG